VLNCWFLVAIAMPIGFQLSHGHTNAWAQALAWLIGSAVTIAFTAIVWLARGRTAQQQPAADLIPGDTKPVPLTRPRWPEGPRPPAGLVAVRAGEPRSVRPIN